MVQGMFNASLSWYAYKMATQLIIWAFGFYLASAAQGSFAMVAAAAAVHALFLQQSGWLCHDILHHQVCLPVCLAWPRVAIQRRVVACRVGFGGRGGCCLGGGGVCSASLTGLTSGGLQVFKERKYGHILGLFWGNFAQGFSISWWVNKHNSHHAVPNLVESCANAADGDPDIDTMPFLAWSKQMYEQRAVRKGWAIGCRAWGSELGMSQHRAVRGTLRGVEDSGFGILEQRAVRRQMHEKRATENVTAGDGVSVLCVLHAPDRGSEKLAALVEGGCFFAHFLAPIPDALSFLRRASRRLRSVGG